MKASTMAGVARVWREGGPRQAMRITGVAVAAFLASVVAAIAQPKWQDGALIAREACRPKRIAYTDWLLSKEEEHAAEAKFAKAHGVSARPFSDLRPRLQTEDEFLRRRAYAGFVCERLTYASEGLKVIAYLWRPAETAGKRLPLVIFNRGGGQDLGKLVPWERDGFHDFVAEGFVVVGTQYRGNDGGEGHDEEGGAEVRDIVNLIPVVRSLGYVDMANVFMMGESRGAMMTFLAMREGVRVNAVAVIGSETDLAANLARRPELLDGYEKDLPGFDTNREATLRQRSAISWVEKVTAPVLIMHGGRDWRVPPAQDLAFASKLESLKKPYELIIFEGDDHPLSFHWRERDRRTIDWFKSHAAMPSRPDAPAAAR